MKQYTETISVILADKLKEKGMPIHIWQHMFEDIKGTDTRFCDVFDWMMEKGYLIVILRDEGRWTYWIGLATDYDTYDDTYEIEGEDFDTWHEAANAAIEKALELI